MCIDHRSVICNNSARVFVGSLSRHASVWRRAHAVLCRLRRGSAGNQERRLAHGAHGLSLPLPGDVPVPAGPLQPGQTGASARVRSVSGGAPRRGTRRPREHHRCYTGGEHLFHGLVLRYVFLLLVAVLI